MFTRPHDLRDNDVLSALDASWGLRVQEIEYAPVGFGSFHWRVETQRGARFVTADDLRKRPQSRLSAALATARSLRDRGLNFVVAPEPTDSGEIVHVIDERYAVAVYPFVAGETHSWGLYRTSAERRAVLDLLAVLHDAPHGPALIEDFGIPHRNAITAAPAGPWNTGPFGELAREEFERHAADVHERLARYDELAAVAGDRSRYVLTHGEPHPANTIDTDDGVVLIDWDTALVAPPERDLWSMVGDDPQTVDDYEERAGRTLRADALDCYRLRWDLSEIAIYLALFQAPHEEDADTSTAWDGLCESLGH